MDTKLTLNLDKTVIEQAKIYAKANKTSLSKIIERHLASLSKQEGDHPKITPLVKSLSGIIQLDSDFDYKKSRADDLLEKYQ